jgi:hypothetical protein
MGKRRKMYGWLFHQERDSWMPPDGMYEAMKGEGSRWVLWRLLTPYGTKGAEMVFEDCDSLEHAVDMAEQDRE